MLEIYFLPYERSLIHVRHNSGDLNDLASKVWDFFRKPPHFVPQIKSWYLGIFPGQDPF